MKFKGVLLDTSFFMRLLNDADPLFNNADQYFNYFLKNKFEMFISTISIAEYCVMGDISELPLLNLKILPFNINHAIKAGKFGSIVFQAKKRGTLEIRERLIIPNDIKLFAQADTEMNIGFYLSSGLESFKVLNSIQKQEDISFKFLNLRSEFIEIQPV